MRGRAAYFKHQSPEGGGPTSCSVVGTIVPRDAQPPPSSRRPCRPSVPPCASRSASDPPGFLLSLLHSGHTTLPAVRTLALFLEPFWSPPSASFVPSRGPLTSPSPQGAVSPPRPAPVFKPGAERAGRRARSARGTRRRRAPGLPRRPHHETRGGWSPGGAGTPLPLSGG